MGGLAVQFDAGRSTLDLGARVHVNGARIALCIEEEWRFPFEGGAALRKDGGWEDGIGRGEHYSLSAPEGFPGLEVQWHLVRYADRPLARVWLTIENRSEDPRRLHSIHLLEVGAADGGSVDLGIPVENAVLFSDSGSGHCAGVSPLLGESFSYEEKWRHFCPPATLARMLELTQNRPAGAGDHASYCSVAVFSGREAGDEAFFLGYAPVQRSMGAIVCRAAQPQGIEFLAAACGLYGYALAPGGNLRSEDLLIGCAPDGLAALEYYAEASAALRGIAITRRPEEVPSGWISWYAYRFEVTEQNILDNARIVAERYLPYGMDIIQPDYGWQKNFICNEWREANGNFPRGMSGLAEELKKMGLRMGFWACPVVLSSESRLFAEHPEYALKDEDGEPICIGKWTWGQREPIYVIDPTVPGALDDAAEQIEQLRRSTGARYWKLDFMLLLLRMGQRPRFSDPSMIPGIEVYRAAVKALRTAAGEDYVYFCSNFPLCRVGHRRHYDDRCGHRQSLLQQGSPGGRHDLPAG